MGSLLLTREVARRAVGMVRPMFAKLFADGIIPHEDLAIVVIDTDGETVLCQQTIGDSAKWEHDYHAIALHKARLSARTGMSTREIAMLEPQRFILGDMKHAGGIHFKGISVGASGVQPYFDEMIAYCVAVACLAQCIQIMENDRSDPDLVVGPD